MSMDTKKRVKNTYTGANALQTFGVETGMLSTERSAILYVGEVDLENRYVCLKEENGIDAALSILEALGYTGGGDGYVEQAVDLLRSERRLHAQRREDASLMTEAQKLYELVNPREGAPYFALWENLSNTHQKHWVKVAKASRKLHEVGE